MWYILINIFDTIILFQVENRFNVVVVVGILAIG